MRMKISIYGTPIKPERKIFLQLVPKGKDTVIVRTVDSSGVAVSIDGKPAVLVTFTSNGQIIPDRRFI